VLAVRYAAYAAILSGEGILISWSTTLEEETAGFVLESRDSDGP